MLAFIKKSNWIFLSLAGTVFNLSIGLPRVILFLLTFGFVVLTTDSLAATFNVSDVTKLRAALKTAQSNGQADTINIAAGTYSTGGVNFGYLTPAESENFSLTIVGAGAGSTILDGAGKGRVLHIITPLVDTKVVITIRSLTIQRGFQGQDGAGLFIQTSSAHVAIENCRFEINSAGISGAGAHITTSKSDITLTSNTFMSNTALSAGGGVRLFSSTGRITLASNIFNNNVIPFDGFGAGADIDTGSGSITLTNNTFDGNTVGGDGGGGGADITSNSGAITIRTNRFLENEAQLGGGTNVESASGAINVSFSSFGFNSTTEDEGGGGKFQSNSGNIILDNNFFVLNFAAEDSGGARVNSNSGNITLTNNAFTGNHAEGGGGGAGIAANQIANITLTNNTFSNNSTNRRGGGLDLGLFNPSATANIFNNIVWGNTATSSGMDISVSDETDGVGATVRLLNNDFSDFFSQCENRTGCTPHITKGNNINQDPRLVVQSLGGAILGTNSPAINKGSATAPALRSRDFEGGARIFDSLPDIGADETISCGGLSPTRIGTNSGETIDGSSGPDVILGFGGDDTINGFGGADRICGGDGNDTINGGAGPDILLGQLGNDTINGGSEADSLVGDRGNDTINGGTGNDQLFGGPDDDTLNGGDNTDACDLGGGQVSGSVTFCETVTNTMSGFSGLWAGDVTQSCEESEEDLICTIEGTLEVENPGTDTAEESLLRFFLSFDEILDEEDVLVQENLVDPLEPQEVIEVKLEGQLPPNQDAIGQFIIALLDATDVVSEINEENNVVVSSAIIGQDGAGVGGGCALVALPIKAGNLWANALILLLVPFFAIGFRFTKGRYKHL